MPRTLTVRRPNSTEVRRLLQSLEAADLTTVQRRRVEVLLLYAQGWNAVEIAANLSLHPNSVYLILRAFDQSGLDVMARVGRRGASPRLTANQRAMIIQIADQPPYELGLPHGRWSLANLRDYLIDQRVVKAISREHLRRVLKKGGFASAGWNANSEAKTRGDQQSWLKSAGFGVISPPRGSCCFSMNNR
jgi:transposase